MATPASPLPAPERHDPYAALRIPNYRWYVVSTLTMTVASQIQGVVVSWQIYDVTKDPLSLGLMATSCCAQYPLADFAWSR